MHVYLIPAERKCMYTWFLPKGNACIPDFCRKEMHIYYNAVSMKFKRPGKKTPLRRFLTNLLRFLSWVFGKIVAFLLLSHYQIRTSENTETVLRCSFIVNKVFRTCFSEKRSDGTDGFPKLTQAKTEQKAPKEGGFMPDFELKAKGFRLPRFHNLIKKQALLLYLIDAS